ncbi:HTH CENPB-type domain-containing protein [Trichonephila clavipes]|nr:HTH CENPB-type domain-containing protein [Trichonephila clavipes]
MAKKYPTWSIKMLHSRGCGRLKKTQMGRRPKWEEDIIKGGNTFDKYSLIDSWIYYRFVEARENFHQVTTRNLQQWALSAAGQFKEFEFKASERREKKIKKRT